MHEMRQVQSGLRVHPDGLRDIGRYARTRLRVASTTIQHPRRRAPGAVHALSGEKSRCWWMISAAVHITQLITDFRGSVIPTGEIVATAPSSGLAVLGRQRTNMDAGRTTCKRPTTPT